MAEDSREDLWNMFMRRRVCMGPDDGVIALIVIVVVVNWDRE